MAVVLVAAAAQAEVRDGAEEGGVCPRRPTPTTTTTASAGGGGGWSCARMCRHRLVLLLLLPRPRPPNSEPDEAWLPPPPLLVVPSSLCTSIGMSPSPVPGVQLVAPPPPRRWRRRPPAATAAAAAALAAGVLADAGELGAGGEEGAIRGGGARRLGQGVGAGPLAAGAGLEEAGAAGEGVAVEQVAVLVAGRDADDDVDVARVGEDGELVERHVRDAAGVAAVVAARARVRVRLARRRAHGRLAPRTVSEVEGSGCETMGGSCGRACVCVRTAATTTRRRRLGQQLRGLASSLARATAAGEY